MDFGDILEQWDQKQKKIPAKQNQVSHKKANAPEKKLTYDDLIELEKLGYKVIRFESIPWTCG